MILVRFTIDNRNRLIFYGNTVGYVKDDAAVVDEMFQTDELSRYLARLNLTPQWRDGIFDRLVAGEMPGEELGQPQKGQKSFLLTGGMYLMKKLFKNITKSAKSAAINCQTSIAAFHRRAVCGNAGEGYIDTAVKVLIAVVLGALVLAGLYAVLNDTVMPTVTQRIQEMFDYAG